MSSHLTLGTPAPDGDDGPSVGPRDMSAASLSPRTLDPGRERTTNPLVRESGTAVASSTAPRSGTFSRSGRDDETPRPPNFDRYPDNDPHSHGSDSSDDDNDDGFDDLGCNSDDDDKMFLGMDDDHAYNTSRASSRGAALGAQVKPRAAQSRAADTDISRRLQRQRNVQRQSGNERLRSIEELVAEMVRAEKECNVAPPSRISSTNVASSTSSSSSSHAAPPPPNTAAVTAAASTSDLLPAQTDHDEPIIPDDEGFCDGGDDGNEVSMLTRQMMLSLRRAATPLGVSKLSSPAAMMHARASPHGLATCPPGAVIRVPRMRRKVKTRRE